MRSREFNEITAESAALSYQQVREKIMQGEMDVNTKYPGASTDPSVLQLAVKEQDSEFIDHLLQNNVDVNVATRSCEPALNLAIRANNPELVKKLISSVTDLNSASYNYKEDYDNWPRLYVLGKKWHGIKYNFPPGFRQQAVKKSTPLATVLDLAITVGSIEIIDILLNAGAKINPSTKGIKPLHWAIAQNKYEIVEHLIKHGADINDISDYRTPLQIAVEKESKKMVELLIEKKVDIDICPPNGQPAINIAIENNYSEIVYILLDAGAAVNPGIQICPPLFEAICAKNYELAKHLINLGADVNVNSNKKTLVQLAILVDDKKILELLIKNKANMNVSTGIGTALHVAVQRGCLDYVKILLKAGADLYAPSHLGTLTHFSLSLGKEFIFDFLLDIGINLIQDNYLALVNAGGFDSHNDDLKIKIKNYVVKLKAGDFHVEPKNFKFLEDEEFNVFYNECRKEIELMKNSKIKGTSCSYYDVLHKSKQELATDLENIGDNVGVLNEEQLRSKFPLYGGMVCYRLEYEQGKNLGEAAGDHLATSLLMNSSFSCLLDTDDDNDDNDDLDTDTEDDKRTNIEFENNKMAAESAALSYQQVREKIMQGEMDVNTKYPGASTDPSVLQLAVKEQDFEFIDHLLRNNVDVNVATRSCEPALNLAIRANNPELVKKIISSVTDLNSASYNYKEDYDNWPRFYILGKKYHKIKNSNPPGFDQPAVEQPTPSGTVLDLAITVGSIEIIDILLNAGAKINPFTSGIKPLHWAIAQNKYEVVEHLIKHGADINDISDYRTPLQIAVERENKKIVELLIEKKVDINRGGTNGKSAINIAIENDYLEMVYILLDAGAAVNPDMPVCPPLHTAIFEKNYELAEHFINLGADINVIYKRKTPVQLAISRDDKKILELLIKNKANLDIFTDEGIALQTAVCWGNLECMKILLKAGADLYPPYPRTLAHISLDYHREFIFDFLLDIGINFINESYLTLINAGHKSHDDALKMKIKNYIVKLKAGDFHVEPKNLQFVEDEEFNDFYNKCRKEIELMKNSKIDGTSCGYYDVLHKSKQELAADLKTIGDNVGVLNEEQLRSKFPLYGGMVCYRLEYEQGKNLGVTADDHVSLATSLLMNSSFSCLLDADDDNDDDDVLDTDTEDDKSSTNETEGVAKKKKKLTKLNEILTLAVKTNIEFKNNKMTAESAALSYQQVREKIMQGEMDVNTKYPGASTDPSVLQLAVQEQDSEFIDHLLRNNVDVNVATESCEPALNLAIRANNPELVKKIISSVTDLNSASYNYKEDYDNWPRFYILGKKIHEMQNSFLLSMGQPAEKESIPSGTILDLAITVGSIEIIDILLNAGAKINPFTSGIKPLHWAVAQNKYEVVEHLIEHGADINDISDSRTPLQIAVEKENKKIAELLIEKKADINRVGPNSTSAINFAIENNYSELVYILLDAGAPVNPGIEVRPPLLAAVFARNYELAEHLINLGADVNVNYKRRTPVQLAISRDDRKILELLIKNKADMNISTSMGTPLHTAVFSGNLECIKILLKAGADLYPPNLSTLSRFSLSQNKEFVFDFLLDIGINFIDDSYLTLINAGSGKHDNALKLKIKNYIVKLKAGDFHVEPKNLQFVEDEEFNDFYNECRKEIELMKNSKIEGTSCSYYDVLHKSKQELAADLKTIGDNVGVLNEEQLRSKFPLYGGMVCYRLEYEQGKKLGETADDQ
ncbi:serine/threonine-protein phosphatase 6 regulatory ankyrin repeat subunit B-like [Microplitis mediator]|uniref:serine/threonine-protein phosphatase 6 regulatory ankyrin repeat subunit B-like n=1 Tax=Microplitis mediator TaxID=375433 RepID=UPI0025576EE5|nr:serine/threonine-protein phosphatase 6 regulatory ankyrin repeat subunit B-like [Microplitis mediator]